MTDLLRSISLLLKLESLRLRMFSLGISFHLLDLTTDREICFEYIKSPDMFSGWEVAF